MPISVSDPDSVIGQFNRLIQELLRGSIHRNCFRPWEIELLLDIESCGLRDGNRRDTLRRYQKAVLRNLEKGATSLMTLSEYLDRQNSRRDRNGEGAIPARGK